MPRFTIGACRRAGCGRAVSERRGLVRAGVAVLVAGALSACANPGAAPEATIAEPEFAASAASPDAAQDSVPVAASAKPAARPPAAPAPTTTARQILAQNERYVIYVPGAGETLQSIAQGFLGTAERDWVLAEFNRTNRVNAGEPMVIPLQGGNAPGVFPDGYQTVPILCYHRFGSPSGKMTVSAANFAAQLDYLARNDYRVIRLSELLEFLEGKRALPRRAVVITIDDGYASAYHTAFPLLKRYGFPATLFIYTDFIGAKDAVSWSQMQEMVASGVIDVQIHSKTHANLMFRRPGESDDRYRERLDSEIQQPRQIVEQRLPVRVAHFAYPYGDTNDIVVQRLSKAEYKAAVTVDPGANAFFSWPFALRRTMIFGEHDLEAFKRRLQVFREVDLR